MQETARSRVRIVAVAAAVSLSRVGGIACGMKRTG